jgi:hypothetical protein
MDFFFRKIVRDNGQALGALAAQIAEFTKIEGGDAQLDTERALLAQGLEDVQGIVGVMVGSLMVSDPRAEGGDPRNLYKVGQNTTRLLMATGDLIVSWLLLRQAEIASTKLAGPTPLNEADTAFYTGKIAAARFFARQALPKLSAERAITEATDNALMDVPEEAF